MKKQCFNVSVVLAVLLTLLGANVQGAGAIAPQAPAESAVSTGMILPAPPSVTPTLGVSGVHTSGLARRFSTDTTQVDTNANTAASSLDIMYSGNVVAPISGTITIPKDCPAKNGYVHHQIVYIQGRNGYAVGLVHMVLNAGFTPGKQVAQGTVIGHTAWPIPTTAAASLGCGWGTAPHIHFTLMKWKTNGIGSHGANYTEQSILNTYIGQWIVKSTSLDGPRNDVPLRGKIEDVVKITATNRGGNIIEGQPTNIVRTMFFVPGNVKQTWDRIAAGDGYYFFKNRQYGTCMTVTGGSMLNGAKIILAACGNNAYQEFVSVAIPGVTGVSLLQARHSAKVIEIPAAAGTATGIQVQQGAILNTANQQWTIAKP